MRSRFYRAPIIPGRDNDGIHTIHYSFVVRYRTIWIDFRQGIRR